MSVLWYPTPKQSPIQGLSGMAGGAAGLGVVISLFTALSCTRVLLRFFMSYKSLRRPTNFLPLNQLSKQII